MKKFFSIFTALAAVLPLCACANTEVSSDSGTVSDPFGKESTFESSFSDPVESSSESLPEQGETGEEDNPTKALWNILVGGGSALARFGYEDEPYEYNGAPITLPVTINVGEDNKTEWSIGIMCCINGVMQKLTAGDQVSKTMIIKENLLPGERVTFDITFDPMIYVEDADKEKINIAFLTTFHPNYQATEEFVPFAGRTAHISGGGWLHMNARPTVIIDPITDSSYEEKIYPSNHGYFPSYYNGDPQNIIGYLNINDDKSLDFKVNASRLMSGTYFAFILQNNEIVAFNGGKEYMKIDSRDGFQYNLSFHLDEAECGDAIECVLVQRVNYDDDYSIAYLLQSPGSILVVREDFKI